MNQQMRNKRLQMELKEVMQNPTENCSAGLIDDNNLDHWEATIIGPTGTVYEGGIFRLEIKFGPEYPYKSPVVTFKTRIIHPNISQQGSICLDLLKHSWSPSLTVNKLLLSICSLLSDPNPKDPLEPEIAYMYETNRLEYEMLARSWVIEYAME